MTTKKGTISVNTSDILPIIKKWLYSEHDIFLRELISNSSDAITKRIAIGRSKNQEIPPGEITVELDSEQKLIRIHDNGLGMTEEEVQKYIAQLAFSGAKEFVEKMKAMGAERTDEIIGKFGLGFYSVFMVADKVQVETLSMEEGAVPVLWTCEGDTEYTFSDSTRENVGTTITLWINKDSEKFLEKYHTRTTIMKYCNFMPYPIFLVDLAELKREVQEKAEGKEVKETIKEPLNEINPIWKRDPTTLQDEDYLNFYRKHFPMDGDPLFWIHLKVDHPFELLGILYFPKLNPSKPVNEHNIHLYAKQVFVSDNVKNIIPDFLSLLKGHIDSPDIPLNVSRSSLQGDPNVSKISNYIIKKVAESLKKLFKKDREKYEKVWKDIGLFVKYGSISDNKFDEQMREFVIFSSYEGKYLTLGEYTEAVPTEYQEKLKDKVIYFEQGKSDPSLLKQLKKENIPSIETDSYIDPHFMQHVEVKNLGEKVYKFNSVDSEIENILAAENITDQDLKVKDLFKDILVKDKDQEGKKEDKKEEEELTPSPFSFKGNLDIEVKSYKNSHAAAYFKVDEQMKRLQQMTKTMGHAGFEMPVKKTLVVNPANPLVQNALKLWEKGGEEKKPLVEKICHHVQDLATISSVGFNNNEEKDKFVLRSQELIQELSSYAL